MQIEKGELIANPSAKKKSYSTPLLVTHGSVAKLTQNNSCSGHSEIEAHPWGVHHRYRWWEHIF
jgi:hypothetical protein